MENAEEFMERQSKNSEFRLVQVGNLTINEQKRYAEKIQAKLDHYRERYNGMFIPNFRGRGRKALTKTVMNCIIRNTSLREPTIADGNRINIMLKSGLVILRSNKRERKRIVLKNGLVLVRLRKKRFQ